MIFMGQRFWSWCVDGLLLKRENVKRDKTGSFRHVSRLHVSFYSRRNDYRITLHAGPAGGASPGGISGSGGGSTRSSASRVMKNCSSPMATVIGSSSFRSYWCE